MPLAVAQYNDHYFHQVPLGLARYGRELDVALRAQGVTVRPVGAWSNMEAGPLDALRAATGGVVLPGGRRSWIARWSLLRRPRIETLVDPVDIVHFTAPCYPVPTGKPAVATIHDLGVFTHPRFFGKAYPRFFHAHLQQMDKRGDRIICELQTRSTINVGAYNVDLDVQVGVLDLGRLSTMRGI